MSRKYGVLAIALAMPVSGCAQVTSGINSLTSALASPNATQAAANLRAGAVALVCNISSIAKLAAVVETGIAQGDVAKIDPKSSLAQVYDVTNTVIVTSEAVCAALQGSVGAAATITSISGGVATATAVGATK